MTPQAPRSHTQLATLHLRQRYLDDLYVEGALNELDVTNEASVLGTEGTLSSPAGHDSLGSAEVVQAISTCAAVSARDAHPDTKEAIRIIQIMKIIVVLTQDDSTAEAASCARLAEIRVPWIDLGPAGADERFRRRFRNEALHLASVDHPNVIPVYGVGETADGDPYLVMKFVEGTDLNARVRSGGALDAASAVHLVDQVGRALDAAHREGLVHRDVKPANVLLSDAERKPHAFLADFGLTKVAEGETELTLSGEWMGTAGFAAPEQIQGDEVGPATDVYSLGCVLFFCLAGQQPFTGSPAQVMWSHVNDALPSLPAQVPNHDLLDQVIERATAKVPEERSSSARELAEAAAAAVEGAPVSPETGRRAPSAGATRRLPTTTSEPPEPTTAMRPRRRWPFIAAAGALAVLAVGAAFALGAFDRSDSTTEPPQETAVTGRSEPTDGDPGSDPAPAESEEPPAFVRTSLDPESGATAVLPQGRRSVESFGPSRQRTRVDTQTGAVAIVDFTPEDAPNPGTGYSTTGGSVSNDGLGATAAEYASSDCREGAVCLNYPIDLGGYGFGVLAAADSRSEARAIARRAAGTLEAPAATLQPPDVVEDCTSELEPNVSDMSVRNMSCSEGDDLIIAAIQNLQPGTFESAGFSCQILGSYGPADGPILGAENIRCADGDRAFRFSWGD